MGGLTNVSVYKNELAFQMSNRVIKLANLIL